MGVVPLELAAGGRARDLIPNVKPTMTHPTSVRAHPIARPPSPWMPRNSLRGGEDGALGDEKCLITNLKKKWS